MKRIFLLYFLIFLCFECFTQSIRFRHITVDNGLPLQNVTKTFEDEIGFIWIESEEGLSRFDGVEFIHTDWTDIHQVYSLDSLETIFLARDNKLYGSYSGKTYAFSTPFTLYRSKQIIKNKNGIFIHHINAFLKEELIFFNQQTDLKYIINNNVLEKIGKHIISDFSSNSSPFSISPYSEEEILINILNSDILKINYFKNKLTLDTFSTSNPSNDLAIFYNTKIQELNYLSKDSIISLGKKRIAFLKPIINNISSIIQTKNSFYISNKNKIIKLKENEEENLNRILNIKFEINDLFLDSNENIWISTYNDGLFCIYNNSEGENNIGLLGNNTVHHLFKTSSLGLLAATDNGLYIISSSWSKFPLKEGNQPKVFHIGENKKDKIIYISTNEGIYNIINGEATICIPEEKNLRSFLIDHSGNLSFFRNKFLNTYSACQSKIISWPAPDSDVEFCLFQDSDQKVWMGTEEGILIYQQGKFTPRKLNKKNGLPHQKINDIIEDTYKNIWIGTDGGISRISGDSFRIKNYTNIQSLKCRKLILNNDGKIWVSSPNGVFLFDPNQNEKQEATNLPYNQVNSMVINESHQLWLGTNKGLFLHNSTSKNIENEPPKLIWRNILLNDIKINPTDLPNIHKGERVEINFSALTFKDPFNVTYQYRLNKTESWINTKNRNLSFSNLQSGKYNLQIRARKKNSDWSIPLEFPFQSLPPWWKTLPFILSCLIGCFLVISFVISNFRKREKNKIETNKRFAELELNALQAQMNPHFIFNTLNAIQHLILNEDTKKANESLNSFASLMRLFLEASKNKYTLLDDEIRMLHHYCDLTRLCYEEKFNFNIKIDPIIDLDDVEIPSMLIQPHVENAIRHGLLPKEKKGLLDIEFLLKEDKLICNIRDNGIGRIASNKIKSQSNRLHQSRGMALTNERADILNQIYDTDIEIKINDLMNKNNEALGTDVMISCLLD